VTLGSRLGFPRVDDRRGFVCNNAEVAERTIAHRRALNFFSAYSAVKSFSQDAIDLFSFSALSAYSAVNFFYFFALLASFAVNGFGWRREKMKKPGVGG
jgi:hypothetical protein